MLRPLEVVDKEPGRVLMVFHETETQMKILAPALAITMLITWTGGQATAQPLSESDRRAIVQEVVDHFRKNPQELFEAIVSWRAAQESARRQAAVPSSGNAVGDVTIFEFTDYGCDPCRKLSAAVDEAAAKDGKVRVVHHDYPVSGQDAVAAALDLVAAHADGKDWRALRRAYIADGVAPENRIKALDGAGFPVSGDARDGARETLLSNRTLAAKAGVDALPAIIVSSGGKVQALSGPMTGAEVEAAISRIRQAASAR